MKAFRTPLFIFSALFSFLAWFKSLYWIWLFDATPELSHLERQALYIENFPFTFWVEEPDQLYSQGVIMAALGFLNIVSIAFLQKSLHQWIFALFIGQAILIQLFQVWTIM
ncbi:MAG: hypothetical protein RIC95_03615 [Vicingaceae bacterium]